jgi:hypothetical protein
MRVSPLSSASSMVWRKLSTAGPVRRAPRELRHWEKIYNTVRPHQSLGYLTPHQFLLQISSQRKE